MYAAGGTGQWDIYGNGANLRFSDNASAGSVVFDRNVDANGGLDVLGSTTFDAGSVTNALQIQATGSYNLYSYHDSGGVGWATGASSSYGELLYLDESNSQIQLYTGGSLRVSVTSTGVQIPNDSGKMTFGTGNDLEIYHDGSNSFIDNSTGGLYIRDTSGGDIRIQGKSGEDSIICNDDSSVELYFNNSKKFETTVNGTELRGTFHKCEGHFRPYNNNTWDLGTSSDRWRNIYTNDLNLSNQGSSNDVDGTWGDWTIQEGENDLFLKNNRSGKKYKFNLTEVS
jgi:hypothetical protein